MEHPAPTDDDARGDLLRLVDQEPETKRTRMQKLVLVGPRGQLVCDVCHLANRTHTRIRGVIGRASCRERV